MNVKQQTRALLKEFKLVSDKCDRWGEALSLRFNIADEMNYREAVPDSWEYGAAGLAGAGDDVRERESYWYEILETMHSQSLINAFDVLERYTDRLERHGQSY